MKTHTLKSKKTIIIALVVLVVLAVLNYFATRKSDSLSNAELLAYKSTASQCAIDELSELLIQKDKLYLNQSDIQQVEESCTQKYNQLSHLQIMVSK